MKNQNAQKKPYDAPKAEFVPFKIEEQLLACGKTVENLADSCTGSMGSLRNS